MVQLDFEKLRSDRLRNPEKLAEIFASRKRRELVRGDGRLFIIAADHPARNAFAVRNNPRAMENRYDLLQRLADALENPGCDGVLGTPDIIDDLALLGCLDDKVVVGSVNRGGLRGSTFEMDDRVTAYDVDGIVRDNLDFAKMLNRINLSDADTSKMMTYTHEVVSQAAQAKLPIMLEPFMSEWVNGKIVNDLSTEAVINSVAIASVLGVSSAYTWMKLPVVENMARVMEATTLPTLLLGGDPVGDESETFKAWEDALELPGVNGLVVGRSLLYPQNGNTSNAIDTAVKLVHG